ncbi:MAG: pseudouridine synthase [Sarcina sp.]
MRINKLLSNFGYCSRKDTRKLIEDERILVNGKFATQGQWVEIDEDEILLDGKKLIEKERIYIALNKPVGIICTSDENKKENIINYMNHREYIFPIGRLDKESEGLIILTNDGDLANDILEAENGHEKEYIVTVDKNIDEKFIEGMSNGVKIGDKLTRKCKVKKINEVTFRIILTQGLNRQIRKMCLVFGYKVQKLKRERIINIELGNLPSGEWRNIKNDELENIKKIIY